MLCGRAVNDACMALSGALRRCSDSTLASHTRPSQARTCTILPMQVTTGTVINGKVVVEGSTLPEGTLVTVLSRGAHESFSLTREEEDELLEAMAEIDRGEFVELDDLLDSLPRRN